MKKVIMIFMILILFSSLSAQQKSLEEILALNADKNTAEALETVIPLYLEGKVKDWKGAGIASNVEVVYLEKSKKMKMTFFPDDSADLPRFYYSRIISFLFYSVLIPTNSFDSFEDLVFLDDKKNLLGTVSMNGLKDVNKMINSGASKKDVAESLGDLFFSWALKVNK